MFSPEGHRALTEAAGAVRRGDRGVLSVTGSDRLTWLQGLLTNDVLALPIGGVCEAAYLTPQGRMISEMRVFNLPEAVLLDIPASLAESLHKRLDQLLFSEDANITNQSPSLVVVDLHGPTAPIVAEGLEMWRHDAFDVPGLTAFVPTALVDAFLADLKARGAVEVTLETLDVLRVEAGRPAFLVDMDEHTIPLEAGLEERAISFTKGCYVGQEVIVRVMHRGGGRVARKLVGLRFAKGELPKPGSPIHSQDRELGRLTSVVWSPALGAGIGLGYVHRDFVTPGTQLSVPGATVVLDAEVTALPFVSRAPDRPA